MSASLQEQIQIRLKAILSRVDLSKTTERMIRAEITAELGEEVQHADNLRMIKDEVFKFIASKKREFDDPSEEDDSTDPPSAQPLGPKKKARIEESATASAAVSNKKVDAASSAASNASLIELGGDKRVTYTNFKGQNYIDLREFYSKGDEKLPGKKGIMLKLDEFRKLASEKDTILDAAIKSEANFSLDLGNKRKCTVSIFKGKTYVDVREYYSGGGGDKPGTKGLSMNVDQFSKFHSSIPSFLAQNKL